MKPTTKPALDEEAENQNRIDWRETLDGVELPSFAGHMVHDDLPTLELGDSDKVEVGDDVYAIGNPISWRRCVTM